MKKFHFQLERVREWREKQAEIQEAKLEKIQDELRGIEERRTALDREREANETAVLHASTVEAASLRALHDFCLGMRGRRVSLDASFEECRQRADAQRTRVLEARRSARLLEKLKQRALSVWQAGFDKELEAQAAESHLSKWNRH